MIQDIGGKTSIKIYRSDDDELYLRVLGKDINKTIKLKGTNDLSKEELDKLEKQFDPSFVSYLVEKPNRIFLSHYKYGFLIDHCNKDLLTLILAWNDKKHKPTRKFKTLHI